MIESIFFKLTNSHILTPEVIGCIQVDSELYIKLFYKGCFAPLLQWFCQGQDCPLSRKSMFENFPVYLELHIEKIYPIFDKLQKHMLTKKPVYSAQIATHIHSVIPNATRTLSTIVIVIIALDYQWCDRCYEMCTDPEK